MFVLFGRVLWRAKFVRSPSNCQCVFGLRGLHKISTPRRHVITPVVPVISVFTERALVFVSCFSLDMRADNALKH